MLNHQQNPSPGEIFFPHLILCSPIAFPVLLKKRSIKMIHILGKITQSYLTSDLKQNLLLTSFPTLTAALLFSVISLINLIQNQNRVQDLTTKSLGLYALLYFYRDGMVIPTRNFSTCTWRVLAWMIHFRKTIPYLYNIDFSALKINCSNNLC